MWVGQVKTIVFRVIIVSNREVRCVPGSVRGNESHQATRDGFFKTIEESLEQRFKKLEVNPSGPCKLFFSAVLEVVAGELTPVRSPKRGRELLGERSSPRRLPNVL